MERRLKQAGYEVATYPSALHLLVNLPAESIRSCILLDVRIPGLDGPALQKRLDELGSTLPIIFLTGYHDIPATVKAIKAGADDFLTKPVTSDDLFRAIEKAFAHHQTLRDLKDKLDSVRARLGRLTPREREVFELVIRGDPNKQIARAMGCTTRTVKAHRHNVMEKMQVKSLAELVSLAERIGIASVPDRRSRPFTTALVRWDTRNLRASLIRIRRFRAQSVGGQVMMSKDRNLVLVVDDDPGMLRAVKRLLRQHAYEPILFSSAQAFKSHTDFENAACVILDINLKDGSGIELRHGLNDAGISVPVIYMTGNDDPAVRKAAVASGCIAFLTKPFSTQSLIEPLKKALAARS